MPDRAQVSLAGTIPGLGLILDPRGPSPGLKRIVTKPTSVHSSSDKAQFVLERSLNA